MRVFVAFVHIFSAIFFLVGLGSCSLAKTSDQLLGSFFAYIIALGLLAFGTVTHLLLDLREQRVPGKKRCFMCAEPVRPEALRCPHCGADLAPSPPANS